jgi:sec-independent protein translocase protein TatA
MGFLKNLGANEIIIILIIVFVLFGASIMKRFAKGVGESAAELKKVKKEMDMTIEGDEEETGNKE